MKTRGAALVTATGLVLLCGCVPGAVREADSLAEQVDRRVTLSRLQHWATQSVAAYNNHVMKAAGPSYYRSPGRVRLPSRQIPDRVRYCFSEPLADVSFHLDASGRADCVVLCWGLKGLYIGPPTCRISQEQWYIRQVKPGIYTYFQYK